MTRRQLEQSAIDAHKRGETWNQFWPSVCDDVARLEPYNIARYRRLCRRLLALVVSGDIDGQEPVGDTIPPWERDDRPSDVGTAARIDWQAAGIEAR